MKSSKKEGESATAFFLKSMAQASFSACLAECVTIPADTAKVRLQIQKVKEGETPKYRGVI